GTPEEEQGAGRPQPASPSSGAWNSGTPEGGGEGGDSAPPPASLRAGAAGAGDLGGLVTERVRPELADLDLRPTQELARVRAEDDAGTGAAELRALGVGPADAVVGISASGRTPYVLGALGAARDAGALTVGLSCQPGSLVSAAADHGVEVVVGPEVLAGSTRLKAGAA